MVATTGNSDTILQALRERRSTGKVKQDAVPTALIEQVIEAATWAPNHKLTAPWRFVVINGSAREALGDVFYQSLRAQLADPESDRSKAQLEKERGKPLRAPVLIAVAAIPSTDPGIVEVEELAAVAAGVQNMLLAAEALGLGAIWRSGWPAYDPTVKQFLGFPPEAHLMAFVYLGYVDALPRRQHDGDSRAYTTWLGPAEHGA